MAEAKVLAALVAVVYWKLVSLLAGEVLALPG